MTFMIYFSLTWILIMYLCLTKRKVPGRPASFLFFICCFVHTNVFALMPQDFNGIDLNPTQAHYLSFLLWRTFIVPLFIIVFFKLFFFNVNRFGQLLFSAGMYALAMASLETAGELLNIYSAQWWNVYWAFIYYFLTFIIFTVLTYWFMRIEEYQEHVV
jgi:hypothetical protein